MDVNLKSDLWICDLFCTFLSSAPNELREVMTLINERGWAKIGLI